jgi:diacylglycerol O-acyltransferase / wax synthase
MPALRQRVIESPFGLTAPRWSYDPHFDLDSHVHRVAAPAPRTREAVLRLARRSTMDAFDRNRPLWELTLVEGLEDGEAALIVKFHPCQMAWAGCGSLITPPEELPEWTAADW